MISLEEWMIRVLIVEDSPVIQQLLYYILDSDPEIRREATVDSEQDRGAA